MAQIREVKKRIRSIENTKKVTHAMELVAGAKMRKSQMAALAGRPYSVNLGEIIDEVKAKSARKHELLKAKNAPGEIIILVTSDRGLAGGLNINLFREILAKEIKNAKFITVGKKATNFAAKSRFEILASFTSEEKSTLDLARTLSKMATNAYRQSQASKISLVYPHFESTIKQTPKWIQLLPIQINSIDQPTAQPTYHYDDLIFEPSADGILESILPHFILTQIYQILLEAKASEHSARMVAMKNATDAAGDLIDDLTLTYNQARQEAITKELLDIITAQRAFE
ncbi:ATP synthase F1 subunit gamma [Candidatus Curtissbacteria bacterium RIFOXYC2_FULL_41_11]|uniref:ATP synthase gamma chain n=1 Tax=Candidatus Curtissbacteria bacterium RIFOXYA1_FULL_41_14 TaxID=1797737 RepID=A0A1F5HB28_9BACT|nr:MAG: ATP synthase gamma chain [Candidatus Curtissbacteria bacterium GW2011_GWD1_40_8]KKS02110.1 MAG: ATP synthase gamma chain [Candidatus Curtissbacteria bacterium GW2011_GWC2_41_21]OGE01377.1 MAG: ATP synthase F1 subunit gamma [Candidatus Curtissbacteria bacterium RIFOXYA1_FULL_41_14]OGE10074.1 MAG: ATP synthase F1 subunit gamma [Candidatus Curtissbacteria bacterium RIFOXYC2_FULL_41_11]OGE15543.1 MAG: ATP synthase F1 subunit gamma [Candidatus Curtissbacteria bacterium RIFOXYC1_FULL_41_36]O